MLVSENEKNLKILFINFCMLLLTKESIWQQIYQHSTHS